MYDLAMSSFTLAMLLRPIAALILFGLILLPIRMAVIRWLPPGRIKSILLLPVGRKHPRRH